MVNLFWRNLRRTSAITIVWWAFALLAGGITLLGGFWVLVYGFVCWRIAVSFRGAIEKGARNRYTTNQLHLRLTGLTLAVLVAQVILLTLAVSYVEGNEIARPAFLKFIGIAGTASLLVPVYFWFPSRGGLQSLVSFLVFAGFIVWWEVVRNLWPDELLLGPAIGLASFLLSVFLLRWPLSLPAPNRATRKAMDELEQDKGKRFDSADELFEDLGV